MARHNDAQDLHLWSIYRQNLNADLSESARVGCSTRSNASERPFGHFQLKEQTVSAILNHPKYGPRLKHPDATHYLQFGLPRVQTHGIRQNHSSSSMLHPNHRPLSPTLSSQSPPIDRTDRAARSSAAGVNLSHFRLEQSQANTNERSNRIVRDIESIAPHRSARRRDESFVETRSIVDVPRRVTTPVAMHSKRLFRSNPNLLDSNRILTNDVNTIINPQSSRVASPVDSSRMDMSGPLMRASWPHLLVRSLYFELDRTSSSRRLCGAQRQKVRVIDNVSFEVRAGDVLGIMSPNGL